MTLTDVANHVGSPKRYSTPNQQIKNLETVPVMSLQDTDSVMSNQSLNSQAKRKINGIKEESDASSQESKNLLTKESKDLLAKDGSSIIFFAPRFINGRLETHAHEVP